MGVLIATVASTEIHHPSCHNSGRQRYSAPGREVSTPGEWFVDTAAESHSCPDLILGRDLLYARAGDLQKALLVFVLLGAMRPYMSPWAQLQPPAILCRGEQEELCAHRGSPGAAAGVHRHYPRDISTSVTSDLSCFRLLIPGLNGRV